ncbi:MAG: enoyl-CoA hydratase [Proteobacteria bacterium]|nr:MAG: enoyl-CoA hydratase [Pseudomonadota bacterium]
MKDAVTSLNKPSEDLVRKDIAGTVCTLTLNRPGQYNALSEEMLEALSTALSDIAENEDIRVIVLTGEGKAFCPGHDLKQMRANHDESYHRELFAKCSDVMQSIVHLPQPVIAKVQGIATAAGCQLVATCDLAIAADDVRFAVSGITIGLFCSTPGVALARNVHRKHAMEMLLTGEFIDAATAERYGLINRAVPRDELDTAVDNLASVIAARPTETVRLGKRLFYSQVEKNLASAYDEAAEAMTCNLMQAATLEGVDAFIEKRKPRWR